MQRWTFEQIPDQSGRAAIVTGANTGIGFETARALARKGAEVTLACRNLDKGRAAMQRIIEETPDAIVSVETLDLADLRSVQDFARRYEIGHDRLDLLILNAGVMVPPEGKTAQGFELQLGINHLGHFALTRMLLPLVQAARDGRVVVLSSGAAQLGTIDFDDLNFEKRGYSAGLAYNQSKLANQLFARELQRRLRLAGSSVRVTAAHPGWTQTDLARTSRITAILGPLFGMKTPKGALPTLRAATDPNANGGDYYGPGGFLQLRGWPTRVEMVERAKNDEVARRLWEVSEALTGARYDLPASIP